MGYEIKEAKDLQKFVEDTSAKFDKIESIDSQMGEFAAQMKEVKETLQTVASRPMGGVDGMGAYKLPGNAAEFVKGGIGAIHKSPSKVTPKMLGGFEAPDDSDVIERFKEASDNLLLLATFRGWVAPGAGDMPMRVDQSAVKSSLYYQRFYRPALEKMLTVSKELFDTGDTNQGAEWVPTEYSTRLIEKLRLELQVANLFEEIPVPRFPFRLPILKNDVTATLFAENGATIGGGTGLADSLGTTAVTDSWDVTGKTLTGLVAWTWEFDEDSILTVLPVMERLLIQSLRNAIEVGIISGDTAGTMDSDITATSATKAFDGLRKVGIAGTADVSGAGAYLDSDAKWASYVGAARALMGKYGVNGNDLAVIAGPVVGNAMRAIPRFATQYAFGSQATNTIGNLNNGGFKPDGMNFIISEFLRENLNATGVYDGVTTNLASLVIVNRNMFKMATLRAIRTQVLREVYAPQGQLAVIASWRGHFKQTFASTDNIVGYVYNLAKS